METISQQLVDITLLSIIVRTLLSTVFAGILGFERERHKQAAGFRTYIIVADASALVMMTNIYISQVVGYTDLVRMPAAVITGLGFLGAGTILVTKNQEVRGLTTAAGLWAVAIIGIAIGSGFYAGGIVCFCFIFLAMQVLRRVDTRIKKSQKVATVYCELDGKRSFGKLIRYLKSHGHSICDLNLFDDTNSEYGEGLLLGTFTLWVNGKTALNEVVKELENIDGIAYITLI